MWIALLAVFGCFGDVKGLLWCCVKKCIVSSGGWGWFHAAV